MKPSNHEIAPEQFAASFGATFLGFATHHGFLRGLLDQGWRPGAVAGSSSGAIVAGLYASGLSLEKMEAVFTRPDLRKFFREPKFPLRALGMLLMRPGVPAMFSGIKLRGLLFELLGDLQIEECPAARLTIAVSNLHTHKIELRTAGSLVDTILASCALPGFLAPRRVGADLLWDGGLGSVVPIEQWLDESQVTHIATHAVIHEDVLRARAKPERYSFPGAMMAGHALTADELLRWKTALLERDGKRVACAESVTPRPRLGMPMSLPPPKPWPLHARDLMAIGEASAVEAIGRLRGAERRAASY